jgi:hypothetical protein
MATDQRTLTGGSGFASDADFRSWGSGLSAQFAAVGLIKTSDTGQIDWSTVLKPSGGSLQRGYEVWRFNDALQATKPVFIRIDFGSGNTAVSPSLWVTVGTGTNGAGTLTGQVGTTKQMAGPGGANSYCSGSSSRLNLAAISGLIVLCVERTKTGAGADTGDGIVRYANSTSQGGGYQLVPFVGSIPAETAVNPALDSNAGGASSLGSDVMLCPTVAFYGKPLFASWCIYKSTEITGLTPITFAHLGATRTYMPLGGNSVGTGNNLQATAGYAIAMLWE